MTAMVIPIPQLAPLGADKVKSWRERKCQRGLHLLREKIVPPRIGYAGEHYLECDVCGLRYHISRVEQKSAT